MTLDAVPSPGDAFIDALAARMVPLLAPILLAALRPAPGSGDPEYATAKQNPLRSRKAFRTAYRAGAFPTFTRNRAITALWVDVVAYMRNQPGAGKVAGERTTDEEMDLAFGPKKRRRKAA